MGVVEAGQSFGEEEILLVIPRKTSAVCNSNDNKVAKIHARYFKLVFK
jgi:hypothetical protein